MNNETELKPCPFCKTKKVQALNGIVHHTKVVGGKSCPLTWLEVDEKYWQNRPIEDAKDARIAELDQQLTEANAHIAGLQAQVDFAKNAMETMQDERDEDH